jgi:SNF2 family DNA or RNA helicase
VYGRDPAADFARVVLDGLMLARQQRTEDGSLCWWELPVQEFLELKRRLDEHGAIEDRYMTDAASAVVAEYVASRQVAEDLRAGNRNDDIDWSTFTTKPYPDQQTGIRFLVGQERSLLADEMGLGKSAQMLYADLHWRRQGHVLRTLVLCPNAVKNGWLAEVRKHVPTASAMAIGNGTQTVLEDIDAYKRHATDYLVAHYDCLVERKGRKQFSMPLPDLQRLLERDHLLAAVRGPDKATPKHAHTVSRVQAHFATVPPDKRHFADLALIPGVGRDGFSRIVEYAQSKAFSGTLLHHRPTHRQVLDELVKLRFCNVIIDEAHVLKDWSSGRTRAVVELLDKVKPVQPDA